MISPSSRSVPSSDNGSHFEDDGADLATSLAPEKGWAGWIMISIRFKGSSIPRLPAGISAGCREAYSWQLQLLAVSDGRRREQSGPELMDTSRRCNKTGRSEPCGRLWQKSMRVRGDEHG